jgi:hypothetical protein
MRVNVMFGLSHAAENETDYEAIRLLQSLIEQLTNKPDPIKAGDALIIRDINGNRVGVADILEDRV